MNNGLLLIGAIVLVASIFGYMYSQEQQSLVQQGADVITGEQQDWGLIQALSGAGIIAGIVLLVAGMLPENRDTNDSYR